LKNCTYTAQYQIYWQPFNSSRVITSSERQGKNNKEHKDGNNFKFLWWKQQGSILHNLNGLFD